MGTIRERAQALRAGLISGYVSIRDVVAWADALIAEDRGRDIPQLFDIALLRSDDLGKAVSLLGELPGDCTHGHVGREIAKLLYQGLLSGKLTEQQAASALYAAVREGFSPDNEFEGMGYYFDDAVDLARQGIYGTLADLKAEMMDYLARVDSHE
jgi:hypothetical protein